MHPSPQTSSVRCSYLAAATFIAAVLCGSELRAERYVVTDLGTLPGTVGSSATALNEQGDVVGYCVVNPATMSQVGFVWHRGSLVSAGKLAKGQYSVATAISDGGLVAGDGDTGNFRPQGWVGVNGKPVNFFSNTGGNTHVLSINDDGVMGGFYTKSLGGASSSWKGALWFPDPKRAGRYTIVDLPKLPTSSAKDKAATAIPAAFNRVTQAAGYVSDSRFGQHACFWNNNAARSIVDLGTFSPADGSSLANGLNDLGQVVGSSHPAFGSRAILWNNDAGHTAHELPLLPGDNYGSATAINNQGTILGSSAYGVPGTWDISPSTPVIWLDGIPHDVAAVVDSASGAGWSFNSLTAINNRGQIVGSGTHHGEARAFLLTPVGDVE